MNKKYSTGLRLLLVVVLSLLVTGCTKTADELVVASGTTKTVTETTNLSKLTIEDGAELVAPEGSILTLTVDGVETGQVLKTWESFDYKFAPGAYEGNIVLTVAGANDVTLAGRGGGMPGGGGEAARGGGMPAGGEGARGAMPEGGMQGGAGAPGGGMPEGGMPPQGGTGAPGGGMPEGGMPNMAGAPGGGMPGGGGGGSPTIYPFRQALYLDANGIDPEKSVLAAVQGETPTGFDIQNIRIESKGSFYENETSPGGTGFNGIFAVGGEYSLKNVDIDFLGDGRSDFQGYGSAIVGKGEGTKLVLDNVNVKTHGVVRAGVIAMGGSKVIVKNSNIEAKSGILPPGYVATMDTSQMRSTLWISGMKGNVRATSVLGAGTEATYINSTVSSDGWGVLSTDGTSGAYLTAINTKAILDGDSGYGNYNDPDAHVAYYGCDMEMATFASCIGSGDVYYGDSTREAVASLNEKFGLGLTTEELNNIPVKPTTINSKKHAVMWHRSGNPLTIDGGTKINTGKSTFIMSAVPATMTVDGAGGVQITSGTGVILQVASDDQPMDMSAAGFYEEPTTAPEPIEGFDTTSAADAATANLSSIDLTGDFYNSVGWGKLTDKLNMAINLDSASITGVISASESHHDVSRITKDNLENFHMITDTACPAINNGVIVNLINGSAWKVTGTSYLTKLALDGSSSVAAAQDGAAVTMTVDGVKTDIQPGGTYAGAIVVSVE